MNDEINIKSSLQSNVTVLGYNVDASKVESNTIVMGIDKEIIKLCANGDIYVHGRLAANDLEVVNGMRDFIMGVRKNNESDSMESLNSLYRYKD